MKWIYLNYLTATGQILAIICDRVWIFTLIIILKTCQLLRILNSVISGWLDKDRLTPNNIAAKYMYPAATPLGDLPSARRWLLDLWAISIANSGINPCGGGCWNLGFARFQLCNRTIGDTGTLWYQNNKIILISAFNRSDW